MNFNEIKKNMLKSETLLSKYAARDKDSIRIHELKEDIRGNFFRDIDRVLYTASYSRYSDKTQVFSNKENDHITKRMTHVQMVSKISRTIGRALNLNEDLIEAIALSHDIGHPPFGHTGEAILNNICIKHNLGVFMHNVQSVRNLMYIEKKGKGLNLCIQVLDGVLCHNGEKLEEKYEPISKTCEEFLMEYEACYHDKKASSSLQPMTLEACIVRISDVIAYVGRDIEDALRFNLISSNDIPKHIADILGSDNRTIINNLIINIIENSYNKPYIKLSHEYFNLLNELLEFNYKHIYNFANDEETKRKYQEMYEHLFNKYLDDLNKKNKRSDIYKFFLNDMSDEYINTTKKERIVIDYIAGMTDNFFIRQFQKYNK